jgi:hypothetical protein
MLGLALRNVPGTLLALQRQPAPGEIQQFSDAIARPLYDFSRSNDDLEEMLALLCVIDDYVGVSNTNMHLRAGVGYGARVLVPHPPEWRWMWSGERSPWFPRFALYREAPGGGWHRAIAALAADLAALQE